MYVISGEAVQCSFENARVVSMILKTAYTDMHATLPLSWEQGKWSVYLTCHVRIIKSI